MDMKTHTNMQRMGRIMKTKDHKDIDEKNNQLEDKPLYDCSGFIRANISELINHVAATTGYKLLISECLCEYPFKWYLAFAESDKQIEIFEDAGVNRFSLYEHGVPNATMLKIRVTQPDIRTHLNKRLDNYSRDLKKVLESGYLYMVLTKIRKDLNLDIFKFTTINSIYLGAITKSLPKDLSMLNDFIDNEFEKVKQDRDTK